MLQQTLNRLGFLAFVESRDPNEEYNWMDYKCCPAARYAASMGLDADYWGFDTSAKHAMLDEFSVLARPTTMDIDARNYVSTYGELAEKLRAVVYGRS